MKKLLFSAASMLLFLGSCSQNELEENVLPKGQSVVTATIEGQGDSRLSVTSNTDNSVFTLNWSTGDSFKVFGDGEGAVYEWTSGEDFTATTTPTNPTYAVYPYTEENGPSISGSTVTMTLNGTPSVENINLPMWAGAPTNGNYAFKHLAAALQFTLNGIPTGYNQLIVKASNAISGAFKADLSETEPTLVTTAQTPYDDEIKQVTVSFEAATSGTLDQVFYIPLPVGIYESLAVSVSDGTNTKELKSWANLEVVRGKMYYTTATVDAASVGAVNEALANVGATPTTVNLTAAITTDEPIEIPENAEDVTLNFATTPTTSDSAPLAINQNADATLGEATSQLNVTMPDEATGLYATIDAPTTTVTLNGGSYSKVTATTATNTLIIGEGVTIEELVVNGGNVVLKGNVKSISSAVPTTVTLGNNLTITAPIAIGDNITLDLNTYKIVEGYEASTNVFATALNISGNNAIIKNGTIEVKNAYPIVVDNEKGLKGVSFEKLTINATRDGDYGSVLLVGYAEVTIDSDVTIKASGNYDHAVEASCYDAGDTDAAKIDIKGATISLSGSKSGQATVIGAGYGSTINVEGATIDGSESLYAVSVFNTGGTINITDGTIKGAFKKYTPDANKTQTISISKGTFTDASAFDYLASEAEITLGADMTLTKAITIPTGVTATINLAGYDVTAPNTDAFEVQGTLTINDEDNAGVVSAGTRHPNASVCAVWANGGTVTINGGYYKAYSDADGKRNDCIYAGYNADNENTAGKITIEGGKFEYVWPEGEKNLDNVNYNGDRYLLNCADKDLYQTLITVNGGQFKNHAPSYEDTNPVERTDKEVQLGEGVKVYNGDNEEQTSAHTSGTEVWYTVKSTSSGNTEYIPV